MILPTLVNELQGYRHGLRNLGNHVLCLRSRLDKILQSYKVKDREIQALHTFLTRTHKEITTVEKNLGEILNEKV